MFTGKNGTAEICFVLRRQRQRAPPSGLPLLAGAASSADSAKGLCPLDSRSSPEWRPPQTAPKGSALWTPTPLRGFLACGRDGS